LTPRITIGAGITGAVNYARGEGRDPVTRELKKLAPGEQSRVAWYGGTGFFWPVETAADIEQARREMESDALHQRGNCRQDCVHLMLAWRPGETPDRAHMEAQVKSALAAIGMANAKALYFVHTDEDYPHIHIVASKINPETGRAYDLKGDFLQLSSWAEHYEAEHGGIISVNRAANNELRAAIAARDAGAVIEALTKQRATFTPAQLDSALAKQIKNESERAQFSAQVLARPEIVQLAEKPDGPAVRYSTRTVIEAELHVLRAGAGLAADHSHGIDETRRAAVLKNELFAGLTAEQERAFRHVTGTAGLALIDGQAGTGKSHTIAAVRAAYEASGRSVIGLAPTNAVAQDMAAEGFGRAATIHSELFALNSGRRQWDAKTVVIVDEAAMIDTKLMAMVTAHTHEARAKLILVGDDRQLSSIDRGGMFGALKDRHGAAALSEVKRQVKLDDRRAAEWMAEGNFADSLKVYDRMGAIHWTRTQGEARAALIAQWAQDSAAQPGKTRFVFAYTNDDVATLNAGLRAVRRQRGELGADAMLETAHGRHNFAPGDRIMFTGTDKKQGITNGRAGTVAAIEGSHVTVTLDGRQPKTITFDAASFDQFRHGYAGTIYKAQGRTLDQTMLYHSEHWRSAASYVALTRHRDTAALFVATNTAKDVKELARQMGRTDDRRAASQFHYAPEIAGAPLTAAELHARFAADAKPPKDQTPTDQIIPKEPVMQPKDGTAQAAKENAREQLDELAAVQAASVRPAAPESGQYAPLPQPEASGRAEQKTAAPEPGETERAARPEAEEHARLAWQQPAFSYETIKRDPWTAVDLAAPENASPTLLSAAYDAAARCIEAVDGAAPRYADSITHGPLAPEGSGDPAQNRAQAETRRDQLHAMIYPIGAPAAEQGKRDRIAALEDMARAAARETLRAAPVPPAAPTRPEPAATASDAARSPEAAQAASSTTTTPAETAAASEPPKATTHVVELPAPAWQARPDDIRPARGARYFLERMGVGLAAAAHFLADMVSPPPKLTESQIHDRLQAAGNLETLHAAAYAEAQQVHEAETDERIFRADQQQQQANLSFAGRYGLPPTSEAVLGREHGPEPDHGLEP
jgi:Ti-type conjugative transfer relaxase TraA